MIVEMLGGLALFLYGMEIMGDGLKASSAGALKRALERVTSNTVKAFLLGVLITAVIQSSTATIVLTVGLIGAGVLNLKQSTAIVLGANVGTTITAQIIRLMDNSGSGGTDILDLFTPEFLAPVASIIGIILIMFVKKSKTKNAGMIAIGFGILFIGLINMTNAMDPLKESDAFKNIIVSLSSNPFYGLLIGIVITAIVQSSSASVGILQALTVTGAAAAEKVSIINFNFAYAYVIGAALGTCITTAIVCSIGTKEDAKRVGFIHVIFSVIGGVLFMGAVEIMRLAGAFPDLWTSPVNGGEIADFQTIFKLVTALILLPFTPLLIKLSKKVVKDHPVEDEDEEIAQNMRGLNQQLLATPALALSSVQHLLGHMCELSLKNYNSAVELLLKNDPKSFDDAKMERIARREELIDRMADATNNYLVTLAPHIETDDDNLADNYLMQTLTEFERIGDLAQNIADIAKELYENSQTLSEDAVSELIIMSDAVREAIELSYKAFTEQDFEAAAKIEPLEEVIDDLNEILRHRHIERVKAGRCTVAGGIYFSNALTNLERLGDQCSDVAVYVLGLDNSKIVGNEHEYIRKLHHEPSEEYSTEYRKNTEKYTNKLGMVKQV